MMVWRLNASVELIIRINTDNAAFGADGETDMVDAAARSAELSRIFRLIVEDLGSERFDDVGLPILDENGNTVGKWHFE